MTEDSAVPEVGRFYSKIAMPYDVFAGSRLFSGLRSDAISSLDLSGDEKVLEVGCGTGGNIPILDEWLGPEGQYLGLDASRGMLGRAASREPRFELSLVQADGNDPPVQSTFDRILVTFVSGVLSDPESAVERWLSLLEPGGRLVLLDAAGRPDSAGPLDWGFDAFVRMAAPPGTRKRTDRPPGDVLLDRVESAHEALKGAGTVLESRTRWFGFVRLSVATVQ